MSQNFYVLSFPGQLPTGGVFLESGCKDTTFFQTAKIFFQLFFVPPHHRADNQRVASSIFFRSNRKILKNRPAKDEKNPFFSPFSGSLKFIFREYLCILLFMCGLNAFKYCGHKLKVYVIILFCSILHRYLPPEGEKDYFVRIRENLLSGTPHVRIPVHNTTGWGAFQYGSAGGWGTFTGTLPRTENRLYGKNGVSLHPISGETR